MCEEGYYYMIRILDRCYRLCSDHADFQKCVDDCVKDYIDK